MRLYHAKAYRAAPDPGNFWQSTVETPRPPPLAGDTVCEVAIIGAGVTGLNAALRLAELGIDCCILDATWPGWGASGRNGGFACLGGTKLSDAEVLKRFGTAQAQAFFKAQAASIDHVAEMLETHAIDADKTGHGEYILAHRPRDFAAMPAEAAFLRRHRGIEAPVLSPEALKERGLHSPAFHGGIHIPLGFGLNPLKYTLGLARAVQAAGVAIHADTPVEGRIRREHDGWHLRTPHGTVLANKVLHATNGYTADGRNELAGWFLPVLSNILVTRPLTDTELADQGWRATELTADTRHLLHYIRLLPDRRLLFGMRGGTDLSPRDEAAMRRTIRASFERIFPAWTHVETPYFWSGLAAVSRTMAAYVGALRQQNQFAALAYHGSGVAMGSWAGKQVANMIAGYGTNIPAPMRQRSRPFPLPRLRRHYLKAAYAWYGWQDR